MSQSAAPAPPSTGTLVAFAAVVGLALLSGSWMGYVSREETWEQHLYTLFFVKAAAGVCIFLGVVFLFIRGRRVLSLAFLIAAALFWFAFQGFYSANPRETSRQSIANLHDRSPNNSLQRTAGLRPSAAELMIR